MNPFLVHITLHNGKIKRSSLEVLSRCAALAAEHGTTCDALIAAADPEAHLERVRAHGADRVLMAKDPVFDRHFNPPLLRALLQAVQTASPSVVAFASTEGTKDVLGALAAALSCPALPDVSEFAIEANHVTATRPVMAAKILADVTAPLAGPDEKAPRPVLVSVRSGGYDVVEREGRGEPVALPFSMDADSVRQTLREIVKAAAGQVDLSEAEAIVAAGRGVRDEEGRRLVEELADVLGAGIGASRALTESGVYDPSLQIGQTGKVVSPQLYIAVGVSGAIQHVAGMANSKVIVAINKDPDAPIFEVADYGMVGDLYQILPPFIEEIRRIKA